MSEALEPEVNRTYLTVTKGRIRRRVDQDTPNAKKREVVNPRTNETVIKWELNYKSITGQIQDIRLMTSGEYDDYWIVKIKKGTEEFNLQFTYQGKYITDLLEKALNLDFSKEVKLIPYSVPQQDGTKNQGLSIEQDGKKILSFFREYEEDSDDPKIMRIKKYINGIPTYDLDHYDKEEYTIFKTKKIKFLKKVLKEKILTKIVEADPIEHVTTSPLAEVDARNIDEEENDDLPF